MPWFPYPGACGGAYPQTYARVDLSVDQSINCYPQRNEAQTGKASPGMVPRPGNSLFSTPATTGGRALWAGEERLFCVSGSKLIEVDNAGVQTVLGDIGAGSGVCTIVSNGLSAGGMLMVINPNTDVLSVYNAGMSTPATPAGARMGFQLRGYGYIVAPDTNTVFQSDGSDFTTWPTLSQGTFITSQDRIVASIEDNGIAWLIGSASSQPVSFTGTAGFALEPILSSFVSEGTCAPYSPASAGGGICMVSGSRRGYGRVVLMRPGNVQRISNYAVEQSLRGVTDWGTVVGSGYSSNGHSFYVLDIPDLALQWVFDFAENTWHQRRGWNGSAYTAMLGRMVQCTFNNNYYVISPTDGKIYKQVDDTLATDLGVIFRSQRTMPVLFSNRLTNYNRFRIDMQTGDGSSTVGANARFSMDGGKTYTAYSYEIMGRNGEAGVLEWPQLGQAGIRGFVADVYFDQGVFAMAGAHVDVTPGFE